MILPQSLRKSYNLVDENFADLTTRQIELERFGTA
jgi:hypothetical protein